MNHNKRTRPDPETLVHLKQLGWEIPELLLVDLLRFGANGAVKTPIKLKFVEFLPTISREKLLQRLANRIRHAYISLEDLLEELEDEGHEYLANTYKEVKFARLAHIRSSELAEIIAADLLKQAGYIVPLERLRFKEDSDRPVPNCDIIGFLFNETNPILDEMCVGEAKSQATSGTKGKNIYEEGLQSLYTRDIIKRNKAVHFVYEVLKNEIGKEKAKYFFRNVGGLHLPNGSGREHKMVDKIGFRERVKFGKDIAFIENMVQKDKAQLG